MISRVKDLSHVLKINCDVKHHVQGNADCEYTKIFPCTKIDSLLKSAVVHFLKNIDINTKVQFDNSAQSYVNALEFVGCQ